MKKITVLFTLLALMTQINIAQNNDPYIWLEEVDAEESLQWVEQWNKKTLNTLTKQAEYQNIFETNLEIYNSTDRIADPTIYGKYVYNFWQDKEHERGIWRRALLKNYMGKNPKWEIVIDLDKLSEEDNEKYVFKGAVGLYPAYNKFMVSLSKGGGDAVVIKEFDAISKSFIKNGFFLPEAKGNASWIDENTLLVSTDFGNGLTTSGYPRQVKKWNRGTELKDAELVFEGKEEDMGIWGYTIPTKKKTYQLIMQKTSFYAGSYFVLEKGKLIKLNLPEDIQPSTIYKEMLVVQLKSDWKSGKKTYKQGSVISIQYDDLINGKMNIQLIVEPDARSSITEIASTENVLLVNMLNNVKSELFNYTWNKKWESKKINAPEYGNISLAATDENTDNYFFYFTNFLEPSTLYSGNAKSGGFKKVKSLPSFFPTENFKVEQFEVPSSDGTKIPYFVVSSKSAKKEGNNPALLYAYGGFEVPMLPSYNATMGTAWLENGGVYILANIRGGGEFGPQWHQAGLKEKRQQIYDDFHAVAEDLIEKKITSSEKLGIFGGSNGGLLVGVAYTQRPDLYNAVVCAVPLLDMKRYNKLLAGASWMAEYGDPDIPEEWNFIKTYSPYHNVKKDMNYPEVFFTTSTRDDRVHPGHARKMVAKMDEFGYKVYYFENTEGGHAGASTNEQRAQMYALIFSYLHMKLMN